MEQLEHSIYISGCSGLIGSNLTKKVKEFYKISYREKAFNKFKSHDSAILIHLASFSKTQSPLSQYKNCIKYDLLNTTSLFENFLQANPNGRIIYISTAGDMYTGLADENSIPHPRSIYSSIKLFNENFLKFKKCNYFIFSVSNAWGGKVSPDRLNGLCDKILNFTEKDKPLDIYVNPETTLDLIHINDLVELIYKSIYSNNTSGKWLVGAESLSIKHLLNINPNLKYNLNEKQKPLTQLKINNSKVRKDFNWTPRRFVFQ